MILKSTVLFAIYLNLSGCGGEDVVEQRTFIGPVTDFVKSERYLYAVSGLLVFRLETGANSWEIMDISRVRSLAIAGKMLYAGTTDGNLFRLEEGESLWTQVLLPLEWRKQSIKPLVTFGKTLYASWEYEKGLYRSDDKGHSWQQIDGGWEKGIAVFLGVSGTTLYVNTLWGQVLISTDRGNSWAPISAEISLLRVVSEEILYARTSADGIVYSETSGKEWIPIGLADQAVHTLVSSGTTLYAGTSEGVFRFESGDNSWTQTELDNVLVMSLAVFGTKLYAGTLRDGVVQSENNGRSWEPINQGLDVPAHAQ